MNVDTVDYTQKYHIKGWKVVGIGKPDNRVRIKLLVRKEPSVKLTRKKKKRVQNIGSNG